MHACILQGARHLFNYLTIVLKGFATVEVVIAYQVQLRLYLTQQKTLRLKVRRTPGLRRHTPAESNT